MDNVVSRSEKGLLLTTMVQVEKMLPSSNNLFFANVCLFLLDAIICKCFMTKRTKETETPHTLLCRKSVLHG
jgi:hypothetical protein